jgi:serine/threonine protein kinase
MLADFGLTSIILDPGVTDPTTGSTAMRGTVPWMAPELLDPIGFGLTHSKSTKASDMYALGMLILEASPFLCVYWKDERAFLLGTYRSSAVLGITIRVHFVYSSIWLSTGTSRKLLRHRAFGQCVDVDGTVLVAGCRAPPGGTGCHQDSERRLEVLAASAVWDT